MRGFTGGEKIEIVAGSATPSAFAPFV